MVASLLTTSCNKSDDKNDWVISQNIPRCFANVIDESTGTSEIVGSMSVGISVNYTKINAEVAITGLKLPDGSSYSSFKLNDLAVAQNENWLVIQGSNPIPDTGSLSNVPVVSNFKLKLFERQIGSGVSADYQPALAISFVINSKYTVYITRQVNYIAGTTRCIGAGSDFSTKETFYVFGIDTEKGILEIVMQNAQFMANMPKMNFNLLNIPFKMEGNVVVFAIDEVTPTVGGTPNDKYPISNLSGTIHPENGFTLKFDCTPGAVQGMRFTVNASGTYSDSPTTAE